MDPTKLYSSETDIDDVLQISNIFTNVSKGEVAKNGDLQKAFGKVDRDEIVREVRPSQKLTTYLYETSISHRFSRMANYKLERKNANTNWPMYAKTSRTA